MLTLPVEEWLGSFQLLLLLLVVWLLSDRRNSRADVFWFFFLLAALANVAFVIDVWHAAQRVGVWW